MYISDVQNRIASIYKNEDIGIDYMFSYLVRHSGYISISIDEREKDINVKKYFMKSFSWLIAIFNKMDRDIIRSVLKKYPEICPYCLNDKCICHKVDGVHIPAAKKIKEVREKFEFYILNKIDNYDLDSVANMLSSIYLHNEVLWNKAGNSYHFKRIFQELAELHESVSRFVFDRDAINRITDELSDVYAWISSAWKILFPYDNIDDELLFYYDAGCPACKMPVCACMRREDRLDRVLDSRRIEEAINYANNIKSISGLDKSLVNLIDEFVESATAIKENNVEYVRKEVSREAKNLANVLDSMVEKSGKYATTIMKFKELIEMFI